MQRNVKYVRALARVYVWDTNRKIEKIEKLRLANFVDVDTGIKFCAFRVDVKMNIHRMVDETYVSENIRKKFLFANLTKPEKTEKNR